MKGAEKSRVIGTVAPRLEELSEMQLDILAEQFYALKQMTFEQFVESVRGNRITINAPEIAMRVPKGHSIIPEHLGGVRRGNQE